MNISRIVLGLTILIVGCLSFYFFKKLNNQVKKDNSFKTALLLPVSHPALEEIEKGFIKTLSDEINISYDVYNGNGDRILMRSQVEKVFKEGYDLICAITTPIALICKELSEQRSYTGPIICCGVSENPVEIGLVKSMQNSENNFVVVSDHYDFDKQLFELLKLYKTKRIVLPYYPSPGLQKQVDSFREACNSKKIELIDVKIYQLNDLYAQVDSRLASDNEVIMVLKDNLIVSGIEALVNLAERKNKLLYVSDLNSFDKGATVAFGVSEFGIGAVAAKMAIDILQKHKSPSTIPSIFASDFELKVNQVAIDLLDKGNK